MPHHAARAVLRSGATIAAVVVISIACGEKSPTAPTPPDDSRFFGPIVTIGGTIRGVMVPGDSLQLSASYSARDHTTGPQDRTAEATWASSDKSVLDVSATGLAIAKAAGIATVTATVVGVSGTSVITVSPSREELSGSIDPVVASDIIALNQQAKGTNNPRPGLIMRWNLPVPVYIQPPMAEHTPCVVQALDIWKTATGIPYVLVGADAPPRLRMLWVSMATAWAHIESTNPDNSLSVVDLVVHKSETSGLTCGRTNWLLTYTHELGHALGIFGHLPDSSCVTQSGGPSPLSWQLCEREIRFLVELYKLPIGARLEPDGSWVR